MATDFDVEQFRKDRNEALLSLDVDKITGFFFKYNGTSPKVDDVFWIGIHKSRTACTDLPMSARSLSKSWLLEKGYSSQDDGDVPVEG